MTVAYFHRTKLRSPTSKSRITINLVQCPISKPFSNHFFTRRMNNIRLPDIQSHYHAHIGNCPHTIQLDFSKYSRINFLMIIGSYLNIIKGRLSSAKYLRHVRTNSGNNIRYCSGRSTFDSP